MKYPNTYSLPDLDKYLGIQFPEFELIGRSIAGVETVFAIPQFNLALDIGRAPSFSFNQDVLALTHWHLDHAGGVAFYLGLRCLNSLKPAKIIVPAQTLEQAREYLESLKKVSDSQIKYELVSAQEPLELKKNLVIKSIANSHCTPSTGYGVYSKKHRLKKEYHNLSKKQLVELKSQGNEIDEHYEELVLAFSGDTRGEFLSTEANQAKVLIMECSFFGDDGDYDNRREYGHTHIKDWVKHADQIQSETVIMSHTSQRYSMKELEAHCVKSLPKELLDKLILFRNCLLYTSDAADES